MSSFLPSEALQALYESEINFQITTFWSSGFYWELGDAMNGYHAEENAETFREAVQQLADAARPHFRYQLLHEEESSLSNRLRSITQWTLGTIDEIEPFFDERPSLQGSKKGGIGFQFLKVRQDSRLLFLSEILESFRCI